MKTETTNTTAKHLSATEKVELSQKIMQLSKEEIQKNGINEKLANITIDGLPVSLNVMAVSSSVARDALDFYETTKDGDQDEYLRWFISTTIQLMTNEFLKKRKPCVIRSYWNFFMIFSENLHHGMTSVEIADMLEIECNENLIRKAAEIYDLI
ncbi:MAG: hypothetical protein K6G22_10960 [Lachnospiraceae bacterium]|nr:hypothetical protein [Lachnospiraceae bacterium]